MARSLDNLHPEGWDLPVAQALVEPVLMAGMPRDYAVLMGTTAMVLGLALRIWWLGLLWWAVAHAFGDCDCDCGAIISRR